MRAPVYSGCFHVADPSFSIVDVTVAIAFFSEETLAAGKTTIGLQAGQNQGASQAG